jgi:hypothetical protein
MLVLSLIPKGQPEHPRYLVANQLRQFWTGDEWSPDENHALLFANETEVAWACTEILTEHAKDKPVFRFVAPVEIEIRSDDPTDLRSVQLWLMRAARLYVDYKQDGLSDGTAILSIDWTKLEQVGEPK